jgi:cytochrome bd-type quinol oxidase subunit 2
MIQKAALFCMALLLQLATWAQDTDTVEMADTMRQNGKIYVVVAVILTIFAGIIIYLVRLDRKITRLEKENKLTIHKP